MEIQGCSNHDPGGHKWGHTQWAKINICLYEYMTSINRLLLVNYTVLLVFYM